MPRISDARARLLEAARTLIWENSYGSTSVDSICAKAGVQKGSFYHFFSSKSELATESLEADWQSKRAALDEIFSSTRPPLERLTHYFDHIYHRQAAAHDKCGVVLGCALFSLGCEVSTQDPAIRAKVQEILEGRVKYFETAVRDAHAEGAIYAPDARRKARALFAFFQGTLTQARILNDLELLREAKWAALDLLGAPHSEDLPERSQLAAK